MEPVSIILIVIFGITSSGFGASMYRTKKRQFRARLRDALTTRSHMPDDSEVSVFDVFWDLGVNEYALEIMLSQRLIPDGPNDLASARMRLIETIEAHGSYAEFISDMQEAIFEFSVAGRSAGDRRALPHLTSDVKRTVPLKSVTGPSNALVKFDRHSPVAGKSFQERFSSRTGGGFAPLNDEDDFQPLIDIDEVGKVEPMRFLQGLLSGGLQGEIDKWWETRKLRMLRQRLDDSLAQLYRYYTDLTTRRPDLRNHLYDAARRWDSEVLRIEALQEQKPWSGKISEDAAKILVSEAIALARRVAWLARGNVDHTLEHLNAMARRGNLAMAGYIVYLNHHAFFSGFSEYHLDYIRRVDHATYRVQEELRELHQRGVV